MTTKICLTGGPCGGKSSAIPFLTQKLEDQGYSVFTIPEVATLLAEGGAHHKEFRQCMELFEIEIVSLQVAMEETFENLAQVDDKPSVIICDRGVYDAPAYVSKETWASLKAGMKWDDDFLLYNRYDIVFHLVTTAIDAEDHYTVENNEARVETPSESAVLDHKFREVWSKHPNQIIIDNTSDFQYKLEEIWTELSDFLAEGEATTTTKTETTEQTI